MEYHRLENNVIYGDFWQNSPAVLAEKIASGKQRKPEAILCTNNIMAVTLCQVLPKYGIRIPEDIAVTGYDGSIYTLMTNPAITTAYGGDKCLGGLAVKALSEQLGIDFLFDSGNVNIRFCGSCGCHNDDSERHELLINLKKLLRNRLDRKPLMFSNYIARMSDCASIPAFAAVLDSLRYLLYDCKAVNICLCEDWRKEYPEYRKHGFSENMQLIYSENQPGQLDYKLSSLLPQLELPHEPLFWVFSSLHYSDKILGYIATQYDKAKQFTGDEHYIG